MQTSNDIINVIKEQGGEVTSALLVDIRDSWYAYRGKKFADLYNRYIGNDPIYSRKLSNENKVNNKIGNDFVGDIVDTKIGYMFGIPIGVEGKTKSESDFIAEWREREKFDDKISDIGKYAAIGGYSWAYLYNGISNVTGKPALRMAHVRNPWEVVPIYDEGTGEQYGAVWFYTVEHFTVNGVRTYEYIAEWYNESTIEKWTSEDSTTWIKISEEPHLMSRCPLVLFQNNMEMLGDCEKVQSLIDGFNKAISDVSSEIEQVRLAYGFIKGQGLDLDDDLLARMKQTGFIPLGADGEIGFVSKTLDIAGIKIILDELRRNIYAFARSVDWSESITGDTRVLGWQVKLMPLENKCIIAERKFSASISEVFGIACNYWKTFDGMNINPLTLKYTFKRNIPKDLEGEARTLGMLRGNVSTETALRLMTFIDDPQAEAKKMNDESALRVDLSSDETAQVGGNGTNPPTNIAETV